MPANNLHSWDLDPSAPPTRSLYPAAPPPGGATWELGDQSLRTRAEPRGGTLLQPWAPWWRPRGPRLWAAAPVLSPRLEWGGSLSPSRGLWVSPSFPSSEEAQDRVPGPSFCESQGSLTSLGKWVSDLVPSVPHRCTFLRAARSWRLSSGGPERGPSGRDEGKAHGCARVSDGDVRAAWESVLQCGHKRDASLTRLCPCRAGHFQVTESQCQVEPQRQPHTTFCLKTELTWL